jgi:hypothetical protein
LLAVSPLAILVVVVALIILAERAGEHNRFMREMRESGQVVDAIVSGVDQEAQLVFVRFAEQDENQVWLLYTHYYPEALEQLSKGQTVRVRYLPASSEAKVLWEDHITAAYTYWGYAVDSGMMLIIAWLIVIIHPEFLYIGYANALPQREGRART